MNQGRIVPPRKAVPDERLGWYRLVGWGKPRNVVWGLRCFTIHPTSTPHPSHHPADPVHIPYPTRAMEDSGGPSIQHRTPHHPLPSLHHYPLSSLSPMHHYHHYITTTTTITISTVVSDEHCSVRRKNSTVHQTTLHHRTTPRLDCMRRDDADSLALPRMCCLL